MSGTNTYVAYFTGIGAGATTGLHGISPCDVALARHDGTSWVSWTRVATAFDASLPFNRCTAGGAPPYLNFEFGRWLSLSMSGGSPVVSYWSVVSPSTTRLESATCTSPGCSAFTTATIASDAGGARVGRWSSLVVDSRGTHAVYYVDDDGSGRRGLRFSTNATGTFVPFDVELSTTTDVGRFASMAAVPAAPPKGPPTAAPLAIVYRDSGAKVAKLTEATMIVPASWSFDPPAAIVDPATTDAGLDAVVAAYPSTGYLDIAYFDAANGVVRLFQSPDGRTVAPVTEFSAPTAPNAPVGLSIAAGATPGMGVLEVRHRVGRVLRAAAVNAVARLGARGATGAPRAALAPSAPAPPRRARRPRG